MLPASEGLRVQLEAQHIVCHVSARGHSLCATVGSAYMTLVATCTWRQMAMGNLDLLVGNVVAACDISRLAAVTADTCMYSATVRPDPAVSLPARGMSR
eukprot:10367018-Alexandrium_andersonii.AAC.1